MARSNIHVAWNVVGDVEVYVDGADEGEIVTSEGEADQGGYRPLMDKIIRYVHTQHFGYQAQIPPNALPRSSCCRTMHGFSQQFPLWRVVPLSSARNAPSSWHKGSKGGSCLILTRQRTTRLER